MVMLLAIGALACAAALVDNVGMHQPPSDLARRLSEVVLRALRLSDLSPTRVVPSAEGGIAFVFCRHDRYADIEIFNSGEVLAVTSDRKGEPTVWAVPMDGGDGLLASVRTIRDYLKA
jgi:hypothetical protein